MKLSEILNRIKESMCRSLVAEPCSYNRLVERPIFKNVARIGLEVAFKDLLRAGIIEEADNLKLTVKAEYIEKYSKPAENVF